MLHCTYETLGKDWEQCFYWHNVLCVHTHTMIHDNVLIGCQSSAGMDNCVICTGLWWYSVVTQGNFLH